MKSNENSVIIYSLPLYENWTFFSSLLTLANWCSSQLSSKQLNGYLHSKWLLVFSFINWVNCCWFWLLISFVFDFTIKFNLNCVLFSSKDGVLKCSQIFLLQLSELNKNNTKLRRINELHSDWLSFYNRWKLKGKPSLYFVKADIADAYGSIILVSYWLIFIIFFIYDCCNECP